MNKNIIISIIVLVVIAVVVILVAPNDREMMPRESASEQTATENMFEVPENAEIFYDEMQGIALPLIFEGNTIIVEVIDGESLVLIRDEDSDQERYADESGFVEFIIDGDTVIMLIEGMEIFNGARYEGSLDSLIQEMGIDDQEGSAFDNLSIELEGSEFNLLTSTTWVWQETLMNNDDVFTPEDDSFSVTFAADGSISGTTDCNNFGGQYGITADRELSFSPFFMTQMYCEGSQEQMFMDMVGSSQFVFFTEDDQLVLLLPFDSGSIIFEAQA